MVVFDGTDLFMKNQKDVFDKTMHLTLKHKEKGMSLTRQNKYIDRGFEIIGGSGLIESELVDFEITSDFEEESEEDEVSEDDEESKGVEHNPPITFITPIHISKDLADFLQLPRDTMISRPKIMKKINTYIVNQSLQNPENGREFFPDAKLKALLSGPTDGSILTFFNITKYYRHHFKMPKKL